MSATRIPLGNAYADLVTGTLNAYNETSFNRINDIAYNTYEGFVQDSWKVSQPLTLELGLRATHFQPWADRLGYGYSIFDYSKYNSSCTPTEYCGFEWNKRNPNVPMGGFPTRALSTSRALAWPTTSPATARPSFAAAGAGIYYHSGQFTNGLDVAAGVVSHQSRLQRQRHSGPGEATSIR